MYGIALYFQNSKHKFKCISNQISVVFNFCGIQLWANVQNNQFQFHFVPIPITITRIPNTIPIPMYPESLISMVQDKLLISLPILTRHIAESISRGCLYPIFFSCISVMYIWKTKNYKFTNVFVSFAMLRVLHPHPRPCHLCPLKKKHCL